MNPKTQVKQVKSSRVPDWPSVASFIGKTYDVIARPMMSRIRHGMMSSVFHATPCHDVTS